MQGVFPYLSKTSGDIPFRWPERPVLELLAQWLSEGVRVIVVTDVERVLGLGGPMGSRNGVYFL
jgi:malic enzyme